MMPPECEACGVEFAPADGALVRCVSTPEDLAWRQRIAITNSVGHPPDTGWFCSEHAEAAQALAADMTLADVVATLRAPVARIGDVYGELVRLMPSLAERAGLDPAGLATSRDRQWHPMDGAQPPNCPFVDMTVLEVRADGVALDLVLERAHWNEDEVARSSVTLALSGAGERDFRVALASPASDAPDAVEFVATDGAVPDDVKAGIPSPPMM
jgi:hypothetical protein